MTRYFNIRPAITVLSFLCFIFLATVRQGHADNDTVALAGRVASLQLGMNGYTVGARLSPTQKEISAANLLDDAYKGTFKFRDDDLHIVASQKDDTILALYQRQDNADFAAAKKIVSGLMGLYGNPTTTAHDKLIYWAYDSSGKISEENFNAAREKTEKLDVLATVKFSSEFEITEESPDNGTEGAIYFIVSSDRLTGEFMGTE